MVDLSPQLYTKIQSQSFLRSGEDFFFFVVVVVVIPYTGNVAILLNGVKPFNRRLNVKSGENLSSSFRENVQRLHDFKRVILPRSKGQKLPEDNILIVTEKFYYFNHILEISAISLKYIFKK